MKKIAVATLFTTFVCILFAGDSNITYDKYIEHIRANAPSLLTINYNNQDSRLSYERAKASGNITFDAGANYYSRENFSEQNPETSGLNNYASVSKLFPQTGTSISGRFDYNYRNDTGTNQDAEHYEPAFMLSLRQPLLQNFFGTVNKKAILTANIDREISELSSKQNYEEIINYYKKLYLQYIAFNELQKNYEIYVANALELYNQTLRRVQSGMGENDDLQRSYSSFLSQRQNLNNNALRLRQIETEIMLSVEGKSPIADATIFENYFSDALNNSYEQVTFDNTEKYEVVNLTLNRINKTVEMNKSATLPKFDFVASYTRKGRSETGRDSFDLNRQEYSAGLVFTHVFGRSVSDIDYEKSLNTQEIYRLSVLQTIEQYELDLRNIIMQVENCKTIIELKNENIRALNSQLATERLKYSQARAGLNSIIDTQNRIAAERVNLINEKMKLISLYFDYLTLTK